MSESKAMSDIEIARNCCVQPISEIARNAGFDPAHLIPYGATKAKISLDALPKTGGVKKAKYIDVTAITPTPLGEGKTTTTIGLTQGLGKLGFRAVATVRQPSMGPTFGIKGGAAGGGYSQIIPMEDINLHLTGDIHAVGSAHNLCAAAIDGRLHHESRWSDAYFEKLGMKKLNLDPYAISWNRVIDLNDRVLRNVMIGLGEREDGPMRKSGFDITVASEIMAVLALATSLRDLRERMDRIIVGLDKKGNPVTTGDLQVAGAMTVLMKEALMPNLLQTIEGQAALVHAGPFANIAHGNSSIIADRMAVQVADYVVTESGFASDMGMEKFFNIKCRASGLMPDAVVIVATVRALKMHGGGPSVVPGKALDPAYTEENLPLLEAGLDNLRAHIEIARQFGVPVVVAVNSFPTDTPAELSLIAREARAAGAFDSVVADHWAHGGAGAEELARAVERAANSPSTPVLLYPDGMPVTEKIHTIATRIYGADGVDFSPEALEKLERFTAWGYGNLPVCMAKTHLSLSHDPTLKNRPRGFTLPVRDVRLSAGAGFIYPLTGDIRTMPGLSSKPSYMNIDINPDTGEIIGLS